MEVARHVQSTQDRKLKKCVATAVVFYCDPKHSDTLQGYSHVCCYLFLGGYGQKWVWPFMGVAF